MSQMHLQVLNRRNPQESVQPSVFFRGGFTLRNPAAFPGVVSGQSSSEASGIFPASSSPEGFATEKTGSFPFFFDTSVVLTIIESSSRFRILLRIDPLCSIPVPGNLLLRMVFHIPSSLLPLIQPTVSRICIHQHLQQAFHRKLPCAEYFRSDARAVLHH